MTNCLSFPSSLPILTLMSCVLETLKLHINQDRCLLIPVVNIPYQTIYMFFTFKVTVIFLQFAFSPYLFLHVFPLSTYDPPNWSHTFAKHAAGPWLYALAHSFWCLFSLGGPPSNMLMVCQYCLIFQSLA